VTTLAALAAELAGPIAPYLVPYATTFAPSTRSAFVANKTADQTIADATDVLITFGTVAVNTGSNFNAGTSAWTPPAGTVIIYAQLTLGASIASDCRMQIYKNGALLKSMFQHFVANTTDSFDSINITLIDIPNGSDYYQIYFRQTSGSPGSVSGSGAGGRTYFIGSMI
jgi:hypothetical protein